MNHYLIARRRFLRNAAVTTAGAELVQKAMGYRFIISEVNFPKRIDTDT